MKRPNFGNVSDACCVCGKLHPTPKDHSKPAAGELRVWQPNPGDPPQWICEADERRLLEDEKRTA